MGVENNGVPTPAEQLLHLSMRFITLFEKCEKLDQAVMNISNTVQRIIGEINAGYGKLEQRLIVLEAQSGPKTSKKKNAPLEEQPPQTAPPNET